VALLALGSPSSNCENPRSFSAPEEVSFIVTAPERRQLTRYNIRTPLRFRAISLTAGQSDHFTEAINVSRGGFYFASSAPLQMGTPIEATLRMPAEVTGNKAEEMKCTARVVHVKNQPFGDGRIGFGAEIEKVHTSSGQERGLS
jgi:PilZ domain